MAQADTKGKHGLFSHEQHVHLHTENTGMKLQTAFDEDVMENNHMLVMLWYFSVISDWIFPQYFFFISGAKSKNNVRGYIAI